MKYVVGLTQKVYEEATIYVEAASSDEAEAKALEMVRNGNIEWSFLDVSDDGATIVEGPTPAPQAKIP